MSQPIPAPSPALLGAFTPYPATTTCETSLADLLPRLLASPSGHVLVLDAEQLVGVVTARELVQLIAEGSFAPGRLAAEVMRPVPAALPLRQPVDLVTALVQLRQSGMSWLPVQGADGRLAGVVSYRQLAPALAASPLLAARTVGEVIVPCPELVAPSASVLQVARRLASGPTGCVLVGVPDDDGRPLPLGIVTERAIVRHLAQGADPGATSAAAVMRAPLITCRADETLASAVRQLWQRQVRSLVVPGAPGKPPGLLTFGDVVGAFEPDALARQIVEHRDPTGDGRVARDDVGEAHPAHDAAMQAQLVGQPYLHLIDEYVEDILWVLDARSQRFTYLSPAFERIFGLTRREFYSQSQSELTYVHPEDRATLLAFMQAPPGDRSHLLEYRIIRADGALRRLATLATPVRDVDGTPVRFAGVTRDVTDQRATEELLLRQATGLAVMREREQLAHELHRGLEQLLDFAIIQGRAASQSLAAGHLSLVDAALLAQDSALESARAAVWRLVASLGAPPSAPGSASPPLRVLLADPDLRALHHMRQLLDLVDVRIVGVATDGATVLARARRLRPDVVLLDVRLLGDDGLATLAALQAEALGVRIVVLSDVEDDQMAFEAIRRGADGYLLKDMQPAELIVQLRSLAAGKAALAPDLARRVVQRIVALEQHSSTASPPDPRALLTPRQLEVLTILGRGATYKEAGRLLGFSVPTIKRDVAAAVRLLRVAHRREALALLRAHLPLAQHNPLIAAGSTDSPR